MIQFIIMNDTFMKMFTKLHINLNYAKSSIVFTRGCRNVMKNLKNGILESL